MRKTSEEITREVFGKGSRWIGWDNWLKHQPIFKHIEKKVEEGREVLSTRDFFVQRRGGDLKDSIFVCVDNRTGQLKNVLIPSYIEPGGLMVEKKSSTYFPNGDTKTTVSLGIGLGEMFDDPWRPTSEELDLFQVLYGDEQVLIDMNRKFYGTVLSYNKSVLKGDVKILFMDQ